jgi:hypothetical protein
MKLRTLYLSLLHCATATDKQQVRFSFETRCLCNFVQREARKWLIPTEGFDNIVVQPVDAADVQPPEVGLVKTMSVPIAMDLPRYQSAVGDARQQFFIELLSEGLTRANALHALPLDRLFARIEEFRVGGYRNEWLHKSKRIRMPEGMGRQLQASLHCALTMEQFELTLKVTRKDQVLFEECLLKTSPDEIWFHYKFKDLVVRENHLVVTNRMHRHDELLRIPLSRFAEAV